MAGAGLGMKAVAADVMATVGVSDGGGGIPAASALNASGGTASSRAAHLMQNTAWSGFAV
jgi:hypothetical protein